MPPLQETKNQTADAPMPSSKYLPHWLTEPCDLDIPLPNPDKLELKIED